MFLKPTDNYVLNNRGATVTFVYANAQTRYTSHYFAPKQVAVAGVFTLKPVSSVSSLRCSRCDIRLTNAAADPPRPQASRFIDMFFCFKSKVNGWRSPPNKVAVLFTHVVQRTFTASTVHIYALLWFLGFP
jgi:hypothetical protein